MCKIKIHLLWFWWHWHLSFWPPRVSLSGPRNIFDVPLMTKTKFEKMLYNTTKWHFKNKKNFWKTMTAKIKSCGNKKLHKWKSVKKPWKLKCYEKNPIKINNNFKVVKIKSCQKIKALNTLRCENQKNNENH